MQGLFFDAPLIGVLELLHVSQKTGVLNADAELPFSLSFRQGQIVEAGILDWRGLDALYACPLLSDQGSFSFSVRDSGGEMLAPYGKITADWARYSDDWSQLCGVIGSPSTVFQGDLPLFDLPGGRSAREVAASARLPLFEVAQRVAEGVRSGRLTPTGRFGWYGLRLRHQLGSGRGGRVAAALDRERDLGELTSQGFRPAELRDYLLGEIRAGLRFEGCGWVVRDVTWERQYLS